MLSERMSFSRGHISAGTRLGSGGPRKKPAPATTSHPHRRASTFGYRDIRASVYREDRPSDQRPSQLTPPSLPVDHGRGQVGQRPSSSRKRASCRMLRGLRQRSYVLQR